MTDQDKPEPDDQHNTTGIPNGERSDEQADTSSGGAPDNPDEVNPESGTNADGEPIDNPSGG